MCFSAAASSVAGTSLSAIGVATLRRAETKTEVPFAAIPLLFGIQQLTEGVIWLTFRHDAPLLKQSMTYVYSGFSHVLWPIYVPFAMSFMETARCDGCSARCSCTSRTARSCTAGEYRDDRGMPPTSQRVESPAIPGRFSGRGWAGVIHDPHTHPAPRGVRRVHAGHSGTPGGPMKLICAIVKPFKVPELVDAFRNDAGFPGMTVLQAGGFGRVRPHSHTPAEDLHDFTSHSVVLVGVPDADATSIMERIARIAHTGQPGDGKVSVVPLEAAFARRHTQTPRRPRRRQTRQSSTTVTVVEPADPDRPAYPSSACPMLGSRPAGAHGASRVLTAASRWAVAKPNMSTPPPATVIR